MDRLCCYYPGSVKAKIDSSVKIFYEIHRAGLHYVDLTFFIIFRFSMSMTCAMFQLDYSYVTVSHVSL